MSRRRKITRKLTEEELMNRLNVELFNAVQGDQGEAHVSDAVYARNLPEFFEFCESQLFYAREAARKMALFLRKHKKLRDKANEQFSEGSKK